jgi:signal peptidase I
MHRLTLAIAALGALILAFGLAYFVVIGSEGPNVEMFYNPSQAMAPTLLAGDRFIVRPLPRRRKLDLTRGDLIIHAWPEDRTKKFVKRILGLPGDTISMIGGALQINGRAIAEPYAWHEEPGIDPVSSDFRWQRQHLVGAAATDTADYEGSRDNWGPLKVPSGEYFVLGDNRDNSLDSRWWGFLPSSDVLGEVRRIYFSRDPESGRIRLSRFGHRPH